MTDQQTHYSPDGNWKTLWCSGRSGSYFSISSRLDDVTCGTCRRKLIAQAKRAAAAA